MVNFEDEMNSLRVRLKNFEKFLKDNDLNELPEILEKHTIALNRFSQAIEEQNRIALQQLDQQNPQVSKQAFQYTKNSSQRI